MLWLALQFPNLPLEALHCPPSPEQARAVAAGGRVIVANALARQAGVVVGQSTASALGLAPALRVHARQPEAEAAALQRLACWAGRFSPTVSCRPPAGLLLEIGGCLRLFGGRDGLLAALQAEAEALDWVWDWAVAPTPLAASWLAGAGRMQWCSEADELRRALADLPCVATGWPAPVLQRLAGFGIQTLGQLADLSTAALRQRLGQAVIDTWLKARGDLPDPQRPFVFPASFSERLELPGRVEQAQGLAFAARRLFAALAGWLQQRGQRVLRCRLLLHDEAGQVLPIPLAFAAPNADAERFARLLGEHLAGLVLPRPVEAMQLVADELCAARPENTALFGPQPATGEGIPACLERLRARLGAAAVCLPRRGDDHRPEQAAQWQAGDAGAPGQPGQPCAGRWFDAGQRPLWLLPVPQALTEQAGRPQWQGALQLLSRPERIESGWWDEGEPAAVGDVRRDYFVASTLRGQIVWIFRDAAGWYLHGLFA